MLKPPNYSSDCAFFFFKNRRAKALLETLVESGAGEFVVEKLADGVPAAWRFVMRYHFVVILFLFLLPLICCNLCLCRLSQTAGRLHAGLLRGEVPNKVACKIKKYLFF